MIEEYKEIIPKLVEPGLAAGALET